MHHANEVSIRNMIDAGSKADGLNSDKSKPVASPAKGVWPVQPKRKRGFHRALRRKEPWALHEKAWKDLMNETVKELYKSVIDRPSICGLWRQVYEGDPIPIKIEYPKKL